MKLNSYNYEIKLILKAHKIIIIIVKKSGFDIYKYKKFIN